MHIGLCLCARLPRIPTETRVLLVLHRLEARKTTNTGRLALACLPNSDEIVRGLYPTAAPGEDDPHGAAAPAHRGDRAIVPDDGRDVLWLFPHDDAEVLTPRPPDARPVTLVVPDGTWRQASKMRVRVPHPAGTRTVRLPDGPPSRYRLRREAHPHALATLEAIARALGILEGPPVAAALESVLAAMVDRTLWVKGECPDEAVSWGLPPAAQRHDPRSARRTEP